MVKVCILRNVLGEQLDLCVDGDQFRWTDGPPENYWTYGNQDSALDIETFAKLIGLNIRLPPAQFANAFKTLGASNVRWQHAMPKEEFKAYMNGMLDDIRIISGSKYIAYYTDVFRCIKEGLRALERAKINKQRLNKYILDEQNESNRSSLLSLLPDKDGFAQQTKYDQVGTQTGRLTIKSGPKILTLSKKYRDVITSRYDGGAIISLDFKSLEPRIILEMNEIIASKDIYATISESIFDNKFPRLTVKAITISLLYGAHESTIERVSGLSGKDLKHAIAGISDFFKLETLFNSLLNEIKANGVIKNIFGRPIVVNDRKKLVNYFAQSSAAEGALLGFTNIINFIKERQFRMHPIFIIHDDLMLDVHPNEMKYIDQIIKQCERIPGLKQTFPVRCEEICV